MTGTASVRHGLCLGHGQTRVRNFFYEFPCPPPPIGFREPERETGPMPPAGLAPLPGDRDL